MTAREAIEYALAKAKKAKEEKSKGTEATAAAQDAAVAADGSTGGGVSAESLAEHDKKYHNGRYTGGKCKFRTDHGIATEPAPDGAEVTSTGEGEESVATKAETDVDAVSKDHPDKPVKDGGQDGGGEVQQTAGEISEVEKKVAQALEDGVDESTLPTEDEVAEQDVVSKDGAGTKDNEPAKTDGAQTQNADNAGGDNADAGNSDNAGGADNGGQDGGTDNGGNADANANADGGDNASTGGLKAGHKEPGVDEDFEPQKTKDGKLSMLPDPRAKPRHLAEMKRILATAQPPLKELLDGVTDEDLEKEYDAVADFIRDWESKEHGDLLNGVRANRQKVVDSLTDEQKYCGTFSNQLGADGKPVSMDYDDGFGITFHTTACDDGGHPLHCSDEDYDRFASCFRDLTECEPNVGMWEGNAETSFVCKDAKRALALLAMFEQEGTFAWKPTHGDPPQYESFLNEKVNREINNPVNAEPTSASDEGEEILQSPAFDPTKNEDGQVK